MDDRRSAERRLRGRNLAVLAGLLAFVALLYAVTIVRMGGAG
jgi:hypothetical protein